MSWPDVIATSDYYTPMKKVADEVRKERMTMGNRVYLAGRYTRRFQLQKYAKELEKLGWFITSRWIYGGEEGKSWPEIGALDLDDLRSADRVVCFTGPFEGNITVAQYRGVGNFIEFGLAYGYGKDLHLIGPVESPMQHLRGVRHWRDWEAFLDWSKNDG